MLYIILPIVVLFMLAIFEDFQFSQKEETQEKEKGE